MQLHQLTGTGEQRRQLVLTPAQPHQRRPAAEHLVLQCGQGVAAQVLPRQHPGDPWPLLVALGEHATQERDDGVHGQPIGSGPCRPHRRPPSRRLRPVERQLSRYRHRRLPPPPKCGRPESARRRRRRPPMRHPVPMGGSPMFAPARSPYRFQITAGQPGRTRGERSDETEQCAGQVGPAWAEAALRDRRARHHARRRRAVLLDDPGRSRRHRHQDREPCRARLRPRLPAVPRRRRRRPLQRLLRPVQPAQARPDPRPVDPRRQAGAARPRGQGGRAGGELPRRRHGQARRRPRRAAGGEPAAGLHRDLRLRPERPVPPPSRRTTTAPRPPAGSGP